MASKKANTTKVPVAVWARYRCYDFCVAASLVGAAQEFLYKGRQVKVSLPKKPKRADWQDTNAPITCWHYRGQGSQKRPIDFHIHEITVLLDTSISKQIPSNALGKVHHEKFTHRQRDQLYGLHHRFDPMMDEVFDYCTEVMRWKTGAYEMNQSTAKRQRSSWAKYLVDGKTGERFFSNGVNMEAHFHTGITKRAWKQSELAMREGQGAPVWQLFLCNAVHKIATKSHREFVIDLAIAIETVIRELISTFLGERRNQAIAKILGRAGLTEIISKWKQLGFNSKGWKALSTELKTVQSIVEIRNGIMHRGVDPLDVDTYQLFSQTQRFINQAERELARRIGTQHRINPDFPN